MERIQNRGDERRRDRRARGAQPPRDDQDDRERAFEGHDEGEEYDEQRFGGDESRRLGHAQPGPGRPGENFEDWQQPRQYGERSGRPARSGREGYGGQGYAGQGYGSQGAGEPYEPFREDAWRRGGRGRQSGVFAGQPSESRRWERFGEPYRQDPWGQPREQGYGDRSRDQGGEGFVERWIGRFTGKGPKGYQRSDERIREDLCDCLTADAWIDAEEIRITVNQGEVTLEGTVPERSMKRAAEDRAEEIAGVREVNNLLRVQRPESGRPGEPAGSPSKPLSGRDGH